MMESAWDKQLWQDKMQQLPLEGDELPMWQNMQGLLDKHMPANPPGSGPAAPKNFPGAGTIISAIVIVSAVTVLLFHVLGARDHTKQKTENRTNKEQADSLQNNANTSSNTTQNQKNAASEKSLNDTAAVVTTVAKNTPVSSGNSQKEQAMTSKNAAANKTGAVSGSPANSNGANSTKANINGANGNSPNAISNKKTSVNSVSNKNAGTAQTNHNGGSALMSGNNKSHLRNNPLVSGAHNGGNSYLQNDGSKGKTGHNSGKQGKNSVYQPGLVNINSGSSANQFNSTLQQPSNNAGNGNLTHQDSLNNAITSLIITNQPVVQNSFSQPLNNNSINFNLHPAPGSNAQSAQKTTLGKNKAAKGGKLQNTTTKNKKQSGGGNSKFEFDIRMGYNTGAGASAYPGITAGYFVTPKVGLMIGADVLASRTFSGAYNSTSQYTYRVDTGKNGLRKSGAIAIAGSRKMYTIDIPVTVNYRVSQNLSVYGGPVISIPVKANATNSHVSVLQNSNDTTRNYVATYVSATTINSKFDYGFTAGVRLHFNRFFISGSYMQNFQNYSIGSGLGSNKISPYHTFQLGIGFQLFKPKLTKL